MEIDFTKKKLLTESWMRALADWNKTFLKYLYGKDVTLTADMETHKMLEEEENTDNTLKFIIRGEQKDVQAYARAILAEKEYLDVFIHYGEDHFQSKKKKQLLDQAVQQFEQITGIRWPFKD
jgi:hypothetical protein|tara:strand:+ start:4175 stop:4540 length:366 start_codon:yes stop_codon:yes gene_type:complete